MAAVVVATIGGRTIDIQHIRFRIKVSRIARKITRSIVALSVRVTAFQVGAIQPVAIQVRRVAFQKAASAAIAYTRARYVAALIANASLTHTRDELRIRLP
jgi:hypothetical protein